MNNEDDTRIADLERRVEILELRAIVLLDPANRRVIDLLCDFAQSAFNDGTFTMHIESLCNATGLRTHEVSLALASLLRAGYVSSGADLGWRITEAGRSVLAR